VKVSTVIPLLGAIAISVSLSGCATYQAFAGLRATDLSGLQCGMLRQDVEKILGDPARSEAMEQGTVASYAYDRGYVAPAEGWNNAKYLAAPLLIAAEAVSLGMMDLGAVCDGQCQKGRLEVRYDALAHLVGASEHSTGATYCGTRRRLPRCSYVRLHRRPSTLADLVASACQPPSDRSVDELNRLEIEYP